MTTTTTTTTTTATTTTTTTTSPFVRGGVAVITGAASGIGKALAMRCVEAGMRVVLVDVVPMDDAMASISSIIADGGGGAAEVAICDVSNARAMMDLASRVIENHGPPLFLANNAGISRNPGGTAIDGTDGVYRRTLEVNFLGAVNGVMAFLPSMIASGNDCVIVNTGSKQGITRPPGNVAYNASKAALNAYTEGLQHELRELDGCRVRAHLLVPGWVNSDILINSMRASDPTLDPSTVYFHESRPAPGAWMPRQVVEYLEREMERGTFYIICPDNEVDEHTDNLRMTWAMTDLVERRPPLSRWHSDYKGPFAAYLAANPPKPL
jgi:NAD(P)-dependent dehydrogenase (short-subunit alcohol dehydrogenase family)